MYVTEKLVNLGFGKCDAVLLGEFNHLFSRCALERFLKNLLDVVA
jgi:hypothetical protein